MLNVFSVLILHSTVPHVHLSHANNSTIDGHHHHHDSDSHENHKGETSSEHDESDGPFDFGLSHHSHSGYNADYTTDLTRRIQKKNDSKKLDIDLAHCLRLKSILDSRKKEAPPEYRHVKTENPFLQNCSLRAPPFIG